MSFQLDSDPQFVRNQQFHDACRTGATDVALKLLDDNPDDHHLIDITRSDFPAILVAAHAQHWDLCKALIERGVDLNVKNRQGYSPIHVFAEQGQPELVELAIENAAYVNRRDSKGQTPLYYATRANHEATADVIISKGGDVNSLTNDKDSPMHWIARNGNSALARKLIEHGAHVHGENDMGETPVSLAKDDDLRSELERASLLRTVKDAEEARLAEAVASGATPEQAAEANKPAKRRILKA